MARAFAPRSVIISRFTRARDSAFIHARFSLLSHRDSVSMYVERVMYVCQQKSIRIGGGGRVICAEENAPRLVVIDEMESSSLKFGR